MSDLISREKAINAVYGMTRPTGIDELPYEYAEGAISDLPSADIMEHARAIKEYCKSKPDNVFLACFKCPFFDGLEKNEETVCKLFGKPPHEWDLPEGEKGGE